MNEPSKGYSTSSSHSHKWPLDKWHQTLKICWEYKQEILNCELAHYTGVTHKFTGINCKIENPQDTVHTKQKDTRLSWICNSTQVLLLLFLPTESTGLPALQLCNWMVMDVLCLGRLQRWLCVCVFRCVFYFLLQLTHLRIMSYGFFHFLYQQLVPITHLSSNSQLLLWQIIIKSEWKLPCPKHKDSKIIML